MRRLPLFLFFVVFFGLEICEETWQEVMMNYKINKIVCCLSLFVCSKIGCCVFFWGGVLVKFLCLA